MGADVAASPHCPAADGHQAWEARQSALGCFESRSEPGARTRPPGSFRRRGAFGFPRWLPVRAEALAVRRWRIGNPKVPVSRLGFTRSRSPGFRFGGSLGRSLGSARQPETEVPACRFAAPGPKPGPARRKSAEAPFHRWQCADRSPASAGQGKGRSPRSRLSGSRTGVRKTDGRFTKPAAFASAKGQARSFRMAAASSAARPSLPRTLLPGGTAGPFGSGCGLEVDQPLPVNRLGHELKLSRATDSHQRNPPVDKKDNVHK